MASHRESKRQTWENDFSPPDNVFGLWPILFLVISGSTYDRLLTWFSIVLFAGNHLKLE
jgi:hypothetical protein